MCIGGGEVLDAVPDLIITGQDDHQQVGGDVGGGADLNGDGYQDLCVWACDPERELIHFGGSSMDRVEEVAVVSPGGWDDCFGSGRAVFSSTDSLTGDGDPDLVVGACWTCVQGMYWAGKVYVYSLRRGPVEIHSWPQGRQVPAGGELRYTVAGTATSPDRQTCEAWSQVLKPDGFWYEGNPIWGPRQAAVPFGDTTVVHLTQPIPPGAPPGRYTWTVRVGSSYPDTLWDSSSFEFRVVEP